MPLKDGKLTHRERAFADRYAVTGDMVYAAEKAGYGSPQARGYELLRKPQVRARILATAQKKLDEEILPLAMNVHVEILADPKAPAGARMQGVKLAYDRTLGIQDGVMDKEPHEMTGEEIADAIGKLEAIAIGRAKTVESAQPVPNEADIFS